MKKTCLLSVIAFILNLSSFAQDTLIMSDGSRIIVKIIGITNNKIQYKTWSNLDGPTWTKSMSNIEAVRRKREGLVDSQTTTVRLDFTLCGSSMVPKDKNPRKEKMLSGNAIVHAIDSIYKTNEEMPVLAKRKISQYLGDMPEYIRRECVEKYYLEQFDSALLNEDVEDIVQNGEIYLYLGAEDELPRVIEILAKVFASEGNEDKTKIMIEKLKEYSAQNDNMLDEDIIRIDEETNDLLHPKRFEDDICGKWILLGNVSYKGFTERNLYSPLILEVNDVTQNSGAHMISPVQTVPKPTGVSNPTLAYNRQINTSQAIMFNGQNKIAAFQFASLTVKDCRWLTDASHSMLEDNRQTRAKMKATISSSDVSFGEKLAASVFTELTTGAIDLLARNLNTSSKTDIVYNMVMFPRNENVMNAYVSYVSVKTITSTTSNPRSVYNDYVKDKKMRFVRWEDGDSIFFMSANSRPITLTEMPMDDPLFDEYWQIRRKHSLRNPAYLFPLIGGEAFGAFMIIKGFDRKFDEFIRDEHGNKIPNGLGGYLIDDKKLVSKILLWVGGGLLCMTTTILIPSLMLGNRDKAYMNINRKNLEKLRRKALVSVAIAPTYDSQNNTLGANINLSF